MWSYKPVSDFTICKYNGDNAVYKTRCKPCIGLYYREGGYEEDCIKAAEEASKIPEGHQKCSRKYCGKIKPFSEFKKQKGKPGKTCKDCVNADERERENYPRRVQEIMDVYDSLIIVTVKICNRCNIEKSLSEFDKWFKETGFLHIDNRCLKCQKELKQEYYKNNRESELARVKKYVEEHREEVREYHRLYYLGERSVYKRRPRIYDRKQTDEEYRLMKNTKRRISQLLKKNNIQKDMRSNKIIGCSFEYFSLWLESQFDPNMSWDNYGTYWHIDHVTPCCSFDLLILEERLLCFNWSNCRPLEAKANGSKGDIIFPLQIHLQQIRAEAYIKLLSATHPN